MDFDDELEYLETDNGIKYAVVESIDELEELGELASYDQAVVETHLYNYGVIFISEFGDVIDNEYDLEEIADHYENCQ